MKNYYSKIEQLANSITNGAGWISESYIQQTWYDMFDELISDEKAEEVAVELEVFWEIKVKQ